MSSHKIPEAERYKGFTNWVQFVLARNLVSLLQILPIGLAYRMGRGAGWLSWKFMSKRRLVVRKNLEVVNLWMQRQIANNGLLSKDAKEARGTDYSNTNSAKFNLPSEICHHLSLPLETQVKEVFQRVVANLSCGFSFSRMSPDKMNDHLKIQGLEYLQAAIQKGRAQLSSSLTWVLGKRWHIYRPFRRAAWHSDTTAFMYRPLNNTYLDKWIKKQREVSGARLFSRRDGFHKPLILSEAVGYCAFLPIKKCVKGHSRAISA